MNDIYDGLSYKIITNGLFMDMRKAFDIVDLNKHNTIGIRGIEAYRKGIISNY